VPTGDGDILRHRGVPQDRRRHPAEKPESLMKDLIVKHTPEVVLDTFAGSAPVFGACKRLSIPYIGVEIEEKYCQIAVERLRQEELF